MLFINSSKPNRTEHPTTCYDPADRENALDFNPKQMVIAEIEFGNSHPSHGTPDTLALATHTQRQDTLFHPKTTFYCKLRLSPSTKPVNSVVISTLKTLPRQLYNSGHNSQTYSIIVILLTIFKL